MSSSDASVVEQALRLSEPDDGALVVVAGPTATGKTALAVALAERLGGEVVSADSVQIYRDFDIGSGKPTAEELGRVPHHLIGTAEPLEAMDAVTWAGHASRAIDDVKARGRRPIVCGGTFFWIRALLFGLVETPPAAPEVRARHRSIVEAQGRTALHERLSAVDAPSAERLHPNDVVRVSRALEVFELTGKPLSAWQAEHAFAHVRHRATLLAVARDPAVLTERIRERARLWLASGWIEEVQRLLARGYGEARAMGSVGYAEVRAMLAGSLPQAELEVAIVRATRVFARRQRTWLNHADVHWLGRDSQSSLGV